MGWKARGIPPPNIPWNLHFLVEREIDRMQSLVMPFYRGNKWRLCYRAHYFRSLCGDFLHVSSRCYKQSCCHVLWASLLSHMDCLLSFLSPDSMIFLVDNLVKERFWKQEAMPSYTFYTITWLYKGLNKTTSSRAAAAEGDRTQPRHLYSPSLEPKYHLQITSKKYRWISLSDRAKGVICYFYQCASISWTCLV